MQSAGVRLSRPGLPDPRSWSAVGMSSPHRFPYRELFEAFGQSPVGIAICDRQLHFVRVNRRLAEINKIPLNEHPGKFVCDVVGSLGSIVSDRLMNVFRTGHSLHNAKLVGHLGADPQVGHYIENMFPIYNDRHKVKQVGVFVLTISGLRLRKDVSVQTSDRVPLYLEHDRNEQQFHRQVLSPREIEILCLLASGKSTKEAAASLGITCHTAYMFRSRLMLKLQAHSLTDLIHFAIRHRFVEVQGSGITKELLNS
jgi:DNA-binding CsgD family transcriptional regulator